MLYKVLVIQYYMCVAQCLRDHCLSLTVAYTFYVIMHLTHLMDTVVSLEYESLASAIDRLHWMITTVSQQ